MCFVLRKPGSLRISTQILFNLNVIVCVETIVRGDEAEVLQYSFEMMKFTDIFKITLETGIENEFEVTMVELFRHQMFLFCLYIPPSLNVSSLLDIQDWLISEVDRLLSERSFHHVILVGDFNRFDVNQLCTELDLFDLIVNPTRKKQCA